MYIKKEDLKNYTVVLPESASECLLYAAELLKIYLFKATGESVMISAIQDLSEKIISLGATKQYERKKEKPDFSKIKNDDGFFIDSEKENLYVVGLTDRGVLYGVVEYLERFMNIRFFRADCEAVPTLSQLPLPKEFCYSPPLRMRTYLVGDTYDDTRKDGYITPKIEQLVKTHM